MLIEKTLPKINFYVWNEKYAVIKAKEFIYDSFATIQDKNEITVIIDQNKIDNNKVIKAELDWKIITFDAVLEFNLVGFLAKISNALADENISIFAISAYSTDHVLVKEKDLPKAIEVLQKIRFYYMLKYNKNKNKA